MGVESTVRRALAAWFSVFVLVSAGLAPRAVAQDAEATVEPAQPAATAETETVRRALDAVDAAFGTWVVGPLAAVLFFDLVFWDDADDGLNLPFIVLWLVLGATFFTLRMGFINLRGFGHAVMITTGKYDDPEAEGEVSHFQALASALSATVGLGNIAGVAIAVSLGGPGAIFWMVVAGFLGMSSKFVECTLGQMYRQVDDKGQVLGGPVRYLSAGVEKLGYPMLGKVLAGVFAVMCIGASFGGGNMFQANQAYAQVARVVPFFEDKSWLFGIVIAFLVGLVIIGGI